MNKDELAVRQWFEEWMKATKKDDLELARRLIADDAVFLVARADWMNKESFAAAAIATDPKMDFEPTLQSRRSRISAIMPGSRRKSISR